MGYQELQSSILVNLHTIWGIARWPGPMHPLAFLTKNSDDYYLIKLVDCGLLHYCCIQIIRAEETCTQKVIFNVKIVIF